MWRISRRRAAETPATSVSEGGEGGPDEVESPTWGKVECVERHWAWLGEGWYETDLTIP